MITRTWNRLLLLALGCLLSSIATAQDAATLRLRTLAATCAQCHGTGGRAVDGATVPGLAGQPAGVLADKLIAYKRATPVTSLMQQLARGYSDTQIEQLAAYFAAQPR